MSIIRRRKHLPKGVLGPYKVYELLTGECCYPVLDYSGYGDGVSRNLADFISDEMRADWQAHRDELLSFWRTGKPAELNPGKLPWLMVSRPLGESLPWAERELTRKICRVTS